MSRNIVPWDWFNNETEQGKDISKALTKFYEEANKTLNDIFKGTEIDWLRDVGKREHGELAIIPRVNVSENDNEYKISAELPGVQEKDIDLSIMKNTLIIKATTKGEKEDKNEQYHRIERSYGKFQRSIVIPENAKIDSIKAKFEDGVLDIVIDKNKNAQSEIKKIPIEGNNKKK